MFDTAELGQHLSKKDFNIREPEVRTRLLAAQLAAGEAGVPLVVIVAGVEGAGKGAVVDRLNEWLDTRGLNVRAFWDETDEERLRPRWWRFWRALPSRGQAAVFFGSWYTAPIIAHATGAADDSTFERELARIHSTETMLVADGALVVKLWFHLDQDSQQQRLAADLAEVASRDGSSTTPTRTSPLLAAHAAQYGAFMATSATAIRHTDQPAAPWHLVEATDERFRDMRAGELLRDALEARLAKPVGITSTNPAETTTQGKALDKVDLGQKLPKKRYNKELRDLQAELYGLAWQMRRQRLQVVCAFEGWDAAGKGGAIRRVTRAMDARLYRTITVAAPTDEELAHHYLWRFWRHLPMDGNMTLYDRSWYGRVLVERVEGFATATEWGRAYAEINAFEDGLLDHGTLLLKFWLHIDPDEQLKRFKERERTPWKLHKITADDWRNRDRWDDYAIAVNDMVAHTSTPAAPWTLVAANNKRHARITVLRSLCERLSERLAR